jgi:hypothetical protein
MVFFSRAISEYGKIMGFFHISSMKVVRISPSMVGWKAQGVKSCGFQGSNPMKDHGDIS